MRTLAARLPQVSDTDPRFEEAMRSSLNSAYNLFNVTIDVDIVPVASATRENSLASGLLFRPVSPGQ
jgi:hypothetical protein